MSDNDHPIRAINKCLHRLPLILDILDELETGHNHPGDEDLKHGTQEAVRRMVERLRGIRPTTITDENPQAHEIKIASTWLLGERPRKLLPPSEHADLCQMIGKLIPHDSGMMTGQTD